MKIGTCLKNAYNPLIKYLVTNKVRNGWEMLVIESDPSSDWHEPEGRITATKCWISECTEQICRHKV